LAIVGGDANDGDRVRKTADVADNVLLLGFVTDGELRWLYENALGFAYPSYLEGFGVPVIEALSFGLPTLSAITGAAPEVAGPFAILTDPYDLQSIAGGLDRLVDEAMQDTRENREARRLHAAAYSLPNYLSALSAALENAA
jgi:glycosyltransferase involved in cell wall biosynthesis